MLFKDLKLPGYAQKAMEQLGFTEATEIQHKTIPMLFEGKDVVGKSQTGSGKTFAFAIPAVEKVDMETNAVQVLVVCPTRELAIQVCGEIKKVAQFKDGCKVTPIYGGSNIDRQITAIKKGTKIVVGTPGRIMDHINRRTLKLKNVSMVVLDEADEMLNMGFREDIEEILKNTNPDRQTVMFSATMPKPILEITKSYMKNPVQVSIDNKTSAALSIEQFYINVNRGRKNEVLVELFAKLQPQKTIIFCNTKRMVDDLVSKLGQKNIFALGLHGDMRQNERKKVMEKIHNKTANVLIATDVAARGIDINDIDIIFNYDLPNDTDFYVHRIGRTGRAGKKGKAYTLLSNKSQKTQIESMKKELGFNITEYQLSSAFLMGSEKGERVSSDREGFGRNKFRADRSQDRERQPRRRDDRDKYSKFKSAGDRFSKPRKTSDKPEDNTSRNKPARFTDKPDRKDFRNKQDGDKRFSKSFGDNERKPRAAKKEYGSDAKQDSSKRYSSDRAKTQSGKYDHKDKVSYDKSFSGKTERPMKKFADKKQASYKDKSESFASKGKKFSGDGGDEYAPKDKKSYGVDRKSNQSDKSFSFGKKNYKGEDAGKREGGGKFERQFSKDGGKNRRVDSARSEKPSSPRPFDRFRKSSINKHKK